MNQSLVRRSRGQGRATQARPTRHGRSRPLAVVLTIPLLWAALTLPLPLAGSNGTPPDVSFVALGDAGGGAPGQAAMRDQLARHAGEFDLALFLGDNVNPPSGSADFALNLFGVYGNLIQGQGQPPPLPTRDLPKPAYAVAGDHEYAPDPTASGYFGSFVFPTNGPTGVPAERFYAFDVGLVHFVAFDSPTVANPLTPRSELDAIRAWLISDLDAHSGQVTIVFTHDPAFSAVTGVAAAESPASAVMRTRWFPLFAANGVDLVLGAHERSYQRNVAVSGLTSYVVGSSGGDPAAVPASPMTAASLAANAYLAVEVTGCTITTKAVGSDGGVFDRWTFAAPTCTAAPGRGELFSDAFETGAMEGWSTVQVGPGGSARVVRDPDGVKGYVAQLATSFSDPASYAYARRQLAVPRPDLIASADFRVAEEGPAGGNVPLIRLWDETGERILSLYRQNEAGSKLYVQHSDRFNTTTGVLPLGTWGHLDVRVRMNGGSSLVEVRLNGVVVYQTTSASFTGSAVSRVQIGNETVGQPFTLLVDTFSITDGASPNPTRLPGAASSGLGSLGLPTPTPTLVPAPTPSAPGSLPPDRSVTILDDGFESGALRAWTVTTTGDGQATVSRTEAAGGIFAVHLLVGSTLGSSAAIRQSLAVQRTSLTVSVDAYIAEEGAAGRNVPILRLFDAGGRRLLSVHRQNQNGDKVYVSFGGVIYQSTGSLPIDRWSTIGVRLVTLAGQSLVELTIDGTVAFTSPAVGIEGRTVVTVQFGNDTKSQPLDLYLDNARVRVP
jgi:hypothetical protein